MSHSTYLHVEITRIKATLVCRHATFTGYMQYMNSFSQTAAQLKMKTLVKLEPGKVKSIQLDSSLSFYSAASTSREPITQARAADRLSQSVNKFSCCCFLCATTYSYLSFVSLFNDRISKFRLAD